MHNEPGHPANPTPGSKIGATSKSTGGGLPPLRGVRTACVVIAVSLALLISRAFLPGFFSALAKPLTPAFLGAGVPSIVLCGPELFLAAAAVNTLLYRNRDRLVLPMSGWKRALIVLLCPRLALPEPPAAVTSQPAVAENPTACAAESASAAPLLRTLAKVHLRAFYILPLILLGVSILVVVVFTIKPTVYILTLLQVTGLVTGVAVSLLIAAGWLALWLTITTWPARRHSSADALASTSEPQKVPASSRRTWLTVGLAAGMVAWLIAMIRLVNLQLPAASPEKADSPLVQLVTSSVDMSPNNPTAWVIAPFMLVLLAGLDLYDRAATFVATGVELFAVLLLMSQALWLRRAASTHLPAGRGRRFGLALLCPGFHAWRRGQYSRALRQNGAFFVGLSFYVTFVAFAYTHMAVTSGLEAVNQVGEFSMTLSAVSLLLIFLTLWWLASAVRAAFGGSPSGVFRQDDSAQDLVSPAGRGLDSLS